MTKRLTVDELIAQTGKRKEGFELIAKHIRASKYPLIVEVGVSRKINNFADNFDDGMSTLIWDALANECTGTVHCTDIDTNACKFVRDRCSDKLMVWNADSVNWLASKDVEYAKLSRNIDLLYLDSYDLDADALDSNARNYIYCLTAIRGSLKPGTLIVVDDNDNNGINNGKYVDEFMKRINKPIIYNGYHWIWRW